MRPFSQKTADKLIRWYLSQPTTERHGCHAEHRRLIQRWSNDARKAGSRPEEGELAYRSFLKALDNRSRLMDNRRLRTDEDLEAVTRHRIAVERGRKMGKPSPKLDRLQADLLPVVKQLRAAKLSWAKVSDYLAKYHKLKVSRGFLQAVFAATDADGAAL